MKTRAEAARFVEGQFDFSIPMPQPCCWHYGKQGIRQLFDFIFDGPPQSADEEVFESLRLRNAKVGKWR